MSSRQTGSPTVSVPSPTSGTTTTGRSSRLLQPIPATVLALLAALSFKFGAALSKPLFGPLGPSGAVFVRVASAAVVLLLLWRPRWRGYSASAYWHVLLFGAALAAMTQTFYWAIDRLPLGITVTIEFLGPLGIAIAGSRRALDLIWVALAAGGILLLNPWTGAPLDALGILIALAAGGCWAAYIVLNARIGRSFPASSGLAMSMCIAAIVLAPLGIANAGTHLLEPRLLLVGVGVGILSSVVPFSLEMEALRRLPTRTFGILMSLEPAIPALVGWLTLHEALGIREVIAIVFVTAASIGALRSQS